MLQSAKHVRPLLKAPVDHSASSGRHHSGKLTQLSQAALNDGLAIRRDDVRLAAPLAAALSSMSIVEQDGQARVCSTGLSRLWLSVATAGYIRCISASEWVATSRDAQNDVHVSDVGMLSNCSELRYQLDNQL